MAEAAAAAAAGGGVGSGGRSPPPPNPLALSPQQLLLTSAVTTAAPPTAAAAKAVARSIVADLRAQLDLYSTVNDATIKKARWMRVSEVGTFQLRRQREGLWGPICSR